MSRPKGSLNKKTILKLEQLKAKNAKVPIKVPAKVEVVEEKKFRKRGRPKGTSKVKAPAVVYDMSKVKQSKFLGYCKCQGLIMTTDLISKFVYVCPACGKRSRTKKLIKEIITEKPKSKKEYLNNTIHASHFESLPLDEAQLEAKDLKIQE